MKEQNEKAKLEEKRSVKKKGEKGITLIALVVTIIVLLILAGVSIAMLTGEGGILKQAEEARTRTGRANIIEQARVDLLEKQTQTKGNVSKEDLYEVLDKYFKEVPKTEDTIWDNEEEWKKKELTGKTDPNLSVEIGDIFSGTLVDKTTSGEEEEEPKEGKLAKEVLVVNPDAGEDAEDYEKSPYVKYNEILCRVFYNDDGHGLQIISADNMPDKVTLGYGDDKVKATDFDYTDTDVDDNFKRAAASYNRAVETLNEKAKEYMSDTDKLETTENKIAIDARSLGSIATLENGKFKGDPVTERKYSNEYEYFSTFNEKFKEIDSNYMDDLGYGRRGPLYRLGLTVPSATWVASRSIRSDIDYTTMYVYGITGFTEYPYTEEFVCIDGFESIRSSYSPSRGLRPVFLLSSGVKVIGGKRNEDRSIYSRMVMYFCEYKSI